MKRIFLWLIIWVWVVSLSQARTLLAGEIVDRILAVVGNEIIMESDLRSFQKQQGTRRLAGESPSGSLKKEGSPLDQLIREKLLRQEVARQNIVIADQDLSGALQTILARNQMSLEALQAELSAKGVSFNQYKEQIREELKKMRFIGQVIYPRIHITDGEINRHLKAGGTEEERQKVRQQLTEDRLTDEMVSYLDEVRAKSYVEIKK